MAVKVQLDGSALAALIGGDSEVEVELRHSVVEEFARHYLKGIASEDAFKNAITSEINQVKQQFQNLVSKELERIGCKITRVNNSSYKIELPSVVVDQIQATVRTQVQQALNVTIQAAVKDAVEAFSVDDKVDLNAMITRQLNEKIKRAITGRINAMEVVINDPGQP